MEEDNNSRTPLSPSAEEALDHLTPIITSGDDNPSRDEAVVQLRQRDFEQEFATATIDELLNKGYLYEVSGELRLP
ncbi:hypothetical protein [Haladaptatus sp. NG-SE-30]